MTVPETVRIRHSERGYLLEVPLIVAAVLVALAILLPNLAGHPMIAKVLVVFGAVVLIPCFHYMTLTPGWQPEARRTRYPWNVIQFVILTSLVIVAAGAFVFFR